MEADGSGIADVVVRYSAPQTEHRLTTNGKGMVVARKTGASGRGPLSGETYGLSRGCGVLGFGVRETGSGVDWDGREWG